MRVTKLLSNQLLVAVVNLSVLCVLTSAQNGTSANDVPPVGVPSNSTRKKFIHETTTTSKSGTKSHKCQLGAEGDFREELSQVISGNGKLVVIEFALSKHPSDLLDLVLVDVYKPSHWVRSANKQGHSLLMLDETYSYMSLSTLSIGVDHIKVNVTDYPHQCIRGLLQEDLLDVIRSSFLNDLKVKVSVDGYDDQRDGSLSSDEHICNLHIVPENGVAKFQYTCCHKDPDGNNVCEDIVQNKWLKLLMTLVIIIKVLVVLYSPMFVPESLYRIKYVAAQYIYHIPGPPSSVKVVLTQDPDQFGPENKHKRLRLSTLNHMEVFKELVSSSRWIPERVYEVKVKDVRLSVKARRLLARTAMPVTIMKQLYTNLLRCHIRKLPPLVSCCETNILGRFNPGIKIIKWSQLMRIIAGFCFLTILAIPWILRVSTYVKYDEAIYSERLKAAEDAGLSMVYAGSLVIYFSPLHAFFVLIYIFFIVDSVVYGVISKPMKEKLKFVLRQCLRDMRERSRLDVFGWITRLIVWPFEVFGLVGLIFFPIYLIMILVFTLPIIAFYVIPTLNLSIRLIIHLFIFMCPPRVTTKFRSFSGRFTSLKEKLHLHEVTAAESFVKRSQYTTKGIAFQLIVIIMCLISFWSLTLLVMEVASFFVELMVYTFMGIIVNAAVTMKFVTVLFLLYLYGKQIFSSVSKEYLEYHKIIHDELMKMKRPEINEVAKKEALDQENTAFIVSGDMATNKPKNPEPIIKVKEHQPQWGTSGMLIFLDRQDNPLTPEKFFYETISLNYFGCPGPIYRQVVEAIVEFSKVIMFLMFVFVVVMAFGDAYQVSTTNQLLATVAGGFVPFLFRYIFKADTSGGNIDTTSIQFLTEFHKVINAYRQSWSVSDIVPASVQEWEDSKKAEKDRNGNLDGNGQENPDDVDPNSSEAPLLSSTDIELNTSRDSGSLENKASCISMMDDMTHVDIIIDISTPKTRSVNALLTTGFDKGSVTMLDSTYDRGNEKGSMGGGSSRIYQLNERPIDVV